MERRCQNLFCETPVESQERELFISHRLVSFFLSMYIVDFVIFLIFFHFFFSACEKFLQCSESVKTLEVRKREQRRSCLRCENTFSVYFLGLHKQVPSFARNCKLFHCCQLFIFFPSFCKKQSFLI